MITIKPAQSDDASQITTIWNHYILETNVTFNFQPKTKDEVQQLISDANRADRVFLVAEDRGAAIGFATYFQFRGSVGYARTMEHTIMLDKAAVGFGAGRKLMEALLAQATSAGVHSMFAGVSSANPDGAAFHRALGFEDRGILPKVGHKGGQWYDLILLQKFL